MKKYKHLKEKAKKFRKDGKSIDDICHRLNKSKSTVWYWIKDVRIEKPNVFLKNWKHRNSISQRKAALATRKKFQRLHQDAKCLAKTEWKNLKNNTSFLHFLMLYWCEGFKRTKHVVQLSNSDSDLVVFGTDWFRRLNYNSKEIHFRIQIHEDQDEQRVIDYWKKLLSIDNIHVMRKTNSGKMSGRNWNSKYGVLAVYIADAYLKTKIDYWLEEFAKRLK